MENLKAIAEAAGTDLSKTVKTTCYLTDMSHFALFNEIYAQYFTEKPARSCVAVKELPRNVLVEVEAIIII
jgi:2-iminobutanoate/2-iminopropanoate deaminase